MKGRKLERSVIKNNASLLFISKCVVDNSLVVQVRR
jgi:hypothetical protein